MRLDVPTRRAFINITSQVEECLRERRVREGLALVNSMHVTAAVFIDDDENQSCRPRSVCGYQQLGVAHSLPAGSQCKILRRCEGINSFLQDKGDYDKCMSDH